MPASVLATKLFVPARRPQLVPRARLVERLDEPARLKLISAPAGFGKTTLVSDWVERTTRRVAWLSLDAGDNDPNRFLAHVVAALLGPDTPGETTPAMLVNELAGAAEEIVLVLDDYHVIEAPAVHDSVTFLVDHLPAEVQLLISSRSDPPLPLPRLRTRGQLTELRAADLRFTPDEAADFLNRVMGLSLSAEDVEALEHRTEGWVAGLQLAALSLRDRDDASAFIEAFTGSHRFVLDYLVEEVLDLQPDDLRAFLLQTAPLDRLTGSLCDAVTGRADGDRTLEHLERANLFVVALDERREWYRYHHLFADCLRARTPPGPVHEIASRWFEQHRLFEDAIAHALAANDHDRAGHLIELTVPDIRRTRREATLFGWLRALDEDVVSRSPVLTVYFGFMLLASGDLDGASARLDHAERDLASTGELPMTIAMYRASLAQARGDIAGTTAHARRTLELAGPDDHFARAAGAGFLGLAAWADGDVHAALETFSQIAASLRAAGNLADALATSVPLADMWTVSGRPGQARRLLRDALETAAPGMPIADLHVALAELDRLAGDLDSAKAQLETARSLGELASVRENRFRWFVASARVNQDEGDFDAAFDLLDEAERLYRPGFFPDVRPIPAIRARLWIEQGDLDAAADWARGVPEELGYLREFEHLTVARLLIARGDDPGELLERLLEPALASGREASVQEIRMLQAPARTPVVAPDTGETLSERELQVLRLLDTELSGPEIARELYVSLNTLRTHTKHIFAKLDVTSRRAAVRRARELGLL